MKEIADLIIQSFCSMPEMGRKSLEKPFNIDGYTYSTDGHCAIKIPERKEYEKNNVSDGIKGIKDFVELNTQYDEAFFFPLGIIIPEYDICSSCNGGTEKQKCADCDGDGVVKFTSRSGIDYENDCALCDCTGYLKSCEKCGGLGKIRRAIEINGKLIDPELLVKFNQFDNVKIATTATQELKPIPIKFDGGVAIVMPLRK